MSRHHNARAQAAARRALAPLVASGLAVCHRCGEPVLPDQDWDAGHVDDLGLGGNPFGRVLPEHTSCNRSAGGRLGNQLRPRGRRRLNEWLRFFLPRPLTQPRAAAFFLPGNWADFDLDGTRQVKDLRWLA